MSRIVLVNSILFWSLFSFAGPFDQITCPNTQQIVKELLDAELAGKRFFAAKGECLEQKKFSHFIMSPMSYGETPGELPWHEAAPKTPFVVKKITPDDGNFNVDLEWHVVDSQNPKKTSTIPDTFKVAVYKGKTKDVVGCAGILFEPSSIVVRRSCINFNKLKK